MIVAKFKCESVNRNEYNETVILKAVYGPGNESWSKATPGGDLSMMITNPDAKGKFEPGKSYLLTFAPAE